MGDMVSADDSAIAANFLTESRRQFRLIAGRVHHAVEQLDNEQIWWRAGEPFNSIGNLVLHLTGNISERIGSLVGGQAYERDRDREFAERKKIPTATLLARFDETMSQVEHVLSALPPERLLEKRRYRMLAGEVENTLMAIIVQNLVHVAGHTQEIIALTRTQLGERYRFQLPGSRPK